MSSRCAVALLLLLSIAGSTACGDDSGTSTTRDNAGIDAAPSRGETAPRLVPSAPRPGQRRGHSAEEYQGAYADGKEICAVSSRQKVADIVGSKSTRPKAIARALAKGYKPRLRKQAYEGCLAGLR